MQEAYSITLDRPLKETPRETLKENAVGECCVSYPGGLRQSNLIQTPGFLRLSAVCLKDCSVQLQAEETPQDHTQSDTEDQSSVELTERRETVGDHRVVLLREGEAVLDCEQSAGGNAEGEP